MVFPVDGCSSLLSSSLTVIDTDEKKSRQIIITIIVSSKTSLVFDALSGGKK
jgi:hypothetical protein